MNDVIIEQDKNIFKIRIVDLTDNIKKCIKESLSDICYGEIHVNENDDLIDYEYTLEEFFERYNSKSDKQKKGIIGELLTHITFIYFLKDFKTTSVLFNKEEKSMRKGFDLIMYDINHKNMWYTEVKSGECCVDKTKCIYEVRKCDNKTKEKGVALLKIAESDILDRISNKSKAIWNSALIDVNLTQESNARQYIRSLLKEDSKNIELNNSKESNVILVSMLFEEKGKYSLSDVQDYYNELINRNIFKKVILIAIQKDTYFAVENFLRSEFGGINK